MTAELKDYLITRHICFFQDIRLSDKTWIHRGPIVPFYVIPRTMDEMYDLIFLCNRKEIDYIIVGHTSNLYFTPTFKITAVISTAKMTQIIEKDGYLICDAGVNVSCLAKECVKRGYEGFEGLVGLPGTIGGAIVNNSDCFNCSITSLLLETTMAIPNKKETEIVIISNDRLAFERRSSAIKRKEINGVILNAKIKTSITLDHDELQKKANEYTEMRKRTQEGKAHNLGSIFSSYKVKPLGVLSLGFRKAPMILSYKIKEQFFKLFGLKNKNKVQSLLKIYGYQRLIPYISPKNINCFIWKDSKADSSFLDYIEFMNKYAICGPLEIEILK